MATIRFSPFTCCFRSLFGAFIHGVFSATRKPNSHNHSYVPYSLAKFTGEWFTNHSNHIYIFTPITRIVATRNRTDENRTGDLSGHLRGHFRGHFLERRGESMGALVGALMGALAGPLVRTLVGPNFAFAFSVGWPNEGRRARNSPFLARQKKRIFLCCLWGDPVQNRPQSPSPAGCLLSSKKSRFEVPERGEIAWGRVGVCTMTTKFLDHKKSLFQNFIAVAHPTKNGVLDDFPLCPQCPPPQNRKFYFYCRLAVSDRVGCTRQKKGKKGCAKTKGGEKQAFLGIDRDVVLCGGQRDLEEGRCPIMSAIQLRP